jgi:hypothetical protein
MKELLTTNGKSVLLDDSDFEWASKRTWHARNDKTAWYIVGYHPDFKKTVYLHREIMGFPNSRVDHKNRNGLDCQRDNLRLATLDQSNANRQKPTRPTTSKYKGMYWCKRKLRWRVTVKNRFIGYFKNEEDAARAYDSEAVKLWGEFAHLNFP